MHALQGPHLEVNWHHTWKRNPVERIFECLQAKLEGKVDGSREAKTATLEQELKLLAANPQQMKSLVG